MAPFGTKAVLLVVILASVIEISDAIHGINLVPKILLDAGSVVPRGFVVRALAAKFVTTSPIWIQMWSGGVFREGHTGNYTLFWQMEARGKLADGGFELVPLEETNYVHISGEGVHVAIYSLVQPSAVKAIFSPSVSNLHMSSIKNCQGQTENGVSYVLSVDVSCSFDKLRWPYTLPIKLCNTSDCSDLAIAFAGDTASASAAAETTKDVRPDSDELSEAIQVKHVFPDVDGSDEMTSSVDLRKTVIGLIVWNVFLSVLLLIVAASVVSAHSNISKLKRFHWNNRGIYVVNEPKTSRSSERDDKYERKEQQDHGKGKDNGKGQQDHGLYAI